MVQPKSILIDIKLLTISDELLINILFGGTFVSRDASQKHQHCVGSGLGFNIRIPSFEYGDFHCRENMVVRPSFLAMGIAILRKTFLVAKDGPCTLRGSR